MDDNRINNDPLAKEYPSNSHSKKSEKNPEDTKLKKVVTGEVKKQKKGLLKRIFENVIEDDTKSVGSYILYDVLIPAAKDMISDMVTGGVDMMLFGDRRSGIRGRSTTINGRTVTNYGGFSNTSERRDISQAGRARHDFDELAFATRGEAEEILDRLQDRIIDYGAATVSDLYDMAGVTGSFTDEKYGWTDLRGTSVTRGRRGGFVINLPRTILLE